MSQSIFVSGLPWAMTNQDLMNLFKPIGEVKSACVIIDHETKRSRGYGFVQFIDETNNQKAIDEWDGKDIDGRRIIVNLAHPKYK